MLVTAAETKGFYLFSIPIYLQNIKVMADPQLITASRSEHRIKSLYAFVSFNLPSQTAGNERPADVS